MHTSLEIWISMWCIWTWESAIPHIQLDCLQSFLGEPYIHIFKTGNSFMWSTIHFIIFIAANNNMSSWLPFNSVSFITGYLTYVLFEIYVFIACSYRICLSTALEIFLWPKDWNACKVWFVVSVLGVPLALLPADHWASYFLWTVFFNNNAHVITKWFLGLHQLQNYFVQDFVGFYWINLTIRPPFDVMSTQRTAEFIETHYCHVFDTNSTSCVIYIITKSSFYN